MQSHVAIATSHAPKEKAWSHRQAFTLSCQGRGKERMLNHLNGSLMLTVDTPQIKHIATFDIVISHIDSGGVNNASCMLCSSRQHLYSILTPC
jgi:hypothetical protein